MAKLKLTLAAMLFIGLAACADMQATNNTSANVSDTLPFEEEGNVVVNGQLVPASEYPICPEVSRRVSIPDCEYFTELARRTSEGVGAFNAPDRMQRGEHFRVNLVLAPPPPPPTETIPGNISDTAANSSANGDRPDNTLTTTEDEPPPRHHVPTPRETIEELPGETVEITPLIGRFMSAELRGHGFRIEPVGPVSKEVPLDSQTSWEWQITALSEGAQTLTLTTVVEGQGADGRRIPLKSTIFNRVVTVEVGWSGWLADLLDGLPAWMRRIEVVLIALATLIAAIFGVFVAFRRGRRDLSSAKPPPPAPPPPPSEGG